MACFSGERVAAVREDAEGLDGVAGERVKGEVGYGSFREGSEKLLPSPFCLLPVRFAVRSAPQLGSPPSTLRPRWHFRRFAKSAPADNGQLTGREALHWRRWAHSLRPS